MYKTAAIIVAAGEGRRMGGTDKVFAPLGGRPILARVIDTFDCCTEVDRIVVVVAAGNVARCRQMAAENRWTKDITVGAGGRRRQDSVAAGLKLAGDCRWVVIHDGARPLVTVELIQRGLAAAAESGAAVAAVPVTDTIKVADKDCIVLETPSRHNLWAVQTPQVFRYDIISDAYRRVDEEVTDDAALVERRGHRVKLYTGAYDNIKITNPDDLALAEVLVKKYDR